MTDGWWVDRKQFSIGVSVPLLTMVIATVFELPHTKKRKPYIYIYIYKQGWKSIHNKYKA
jgi:hypothetical protein